MVTKISGKNDSKKITNHFCGSIRKTKMKGGLDVDSIEVYVWLIVFIVLTAIEMATFQLVTIWFAVGAVAAFITSLFSTSLEIQLIVFLSCVDAVIDFGSSYCRTLSSDKDSQDKCR